MRSFSINLVPSDNDHLVLDWFGFNKKIQTAGWIDSCICTNAMKESGTLRSLFRALRSIGTVELWPSTWLLFGLNFLTLENVVLLSIVYVVKFWCLPSLHHLAKLPVVKFDLSLSAFPAHHFSFWSAMLDVQRCVIRSSCKETQKCNSSPLFPPFEIRICFSSGSALSRKATNEPSTDLNLEAQGKITRGIFMFWYTSGRGSWMDRFRSRAALVPAIKEICSKSSTEIVKSCF